MSRKDLYGHMFTQWNRKRREVKWSTTKTGRGESKAKHKGLNGEREKRIVVEDESNMVRPLAIQVDNQVEICKPGIGIVTLKFV